MSGSTRVGVGHPRQHPMRCIRAAALACRQSQQHKCSNCQSQSRVSMPMPRSLSPTQADWFCPPAMHIEDPTKSFPKLQRGTTLRSLRSRMLRPAPTWKRVQTGARLFQCCRPARIFRIPLSNSVACQQMCLHRAPPFTARGSASLVPGSGNLEAAPMLSYATTAICAPPVNSKSARRQKSQPYGQASSNLDLYRRSSH